MKEKNVLVQGGKKFRESSRNFKTMLDCSVVIISLEIPPSGGQTGLVDPEPTAGKVPKGIPASCSMSRSK